MKYRIALTLFSAMLGLSVPVCAFADDSEVTAGAKDQTAQDIVISEAEAGMLEEGRVIILAIDKIEMTGKLELSVTQGDIEVSGEIMDGYDLKKLLNDNPEISFPEESIRDHYSYIVITVEDESTEASVIEINGPELYLDRTLPYGGYALKSVYSNNGMWENTTLDKDKAEKNGIFEYDPVVVDSEYIQVVTAPRDRDDSTIVREVNIGVGQDSISVGQDIIALDAPAYINAEGYAMLPTRAISEALGATVNWDDETQSVSILSGSRIISMKVGDRTMYINGTPVPMNTAPEISNDRVFIPVRDMANAFGIKNIDWDEKTSTITLN